MITSPPTLVYAGGAGAENQARIYKPEEPTRRHPAPPRPAPPPAPPPPPTARRHTGPKRAGRKGLGSGDTVIPALTSIAPVGDSSAATWAQIATAVTAVFAVLIAALVPFLAYQRRPKVTLGKDERREYSGVAAST